MCFSFSWQKKLTTSLHPQLFTQICATKPMTNDKCDMENGKYFPLLISLIPSHGAPQTFGQSDQRVVADQVFGQQDGGERMADVAGARFFISGPRVRADDLLQFGEQLIDRDPFAYPQVDDPSNRLYGFSRAQISVDHVVDVCEIARLLAVPINHRRSAVEQGRDEFRDHAGIG